MSDAMSSAQALLRLAHAEFCRVFSDRRPCHMARIFNPVPYGAPGGGGVMAGYFVRFDYPGTVQVHHMLSSRGNDLALVATSELGRPDVPAVSTQADPEGAYTPEVQRALLAKACSELVRDHRSRGGAWRYLKPGLARVPPVVVVTFDWPGVVRVMSADMSDTLAISSPGQPLQLDTHALRAAAPPGDH